MTYTMTAEQIQKVMSILDDLTHEIDIDVHPLVSPDNWNVYCDLRDMVDELSDVFDSIINGNVKTCDGCKHNGKGYEWCETTKGVYGCFIKKGKD